MDWTGDLKIVRAFSCGKSFSVLHCIRHRRREIFQNVNWITIIHVDESASCDIFIQFFSEGLAERFAIDLLALSALIPAQLCRHPQSVIHFHPLTSERKKYNESAHKFPSISDREREFIFATKSKRHNLCGLCQQHRWYFPKHGFNDVFRCGRPER